MMAFSELHNDQIMILLINSLLSFRALLFLSRHVASRTKSTLDLYLTKFDPESQPDFGMKFFSIQGFKEEEDFVAGFVVDNSANHSTKL